MAAAAVGRSPGAWSWDVTLFKNFAVFGDKRLQLRIGFFNLFNQAVASPWDIDMNLVPGTATA